MYAGHRDHPETQPCRVRCWLGLFNIRQGVHTLISHVVRRLLSHQGAKEDGAVDCGCACLEKPRVSCITINWFERSLVPLISWWWKWVDDAWWKKFRAERQLLSGALGESLAAIPMILTVTDLAGSNIHLLHSHQHRHPTHHNNHRHHDEASRSHLLLHE